MYYRYLLFSVLSVSEPAVDEVCCASQKNQEDDGEDVVGKIDQEIFNAIDEILETV